MRQRSKRNRRRFGARWAARFLAGSAGRTFTEALQRFPEQPMQLLVPRQIMAFNPMVKRAVVQLAGAPSPFSDSFAVFIRGADL